MDRTAIAWLAYLFQEEPTGVPDAKYEKIAGEVLACAPHVAYVAQRIHQLRQRMVRFLMSRELCQFLVLGSGLPGPGHVHHLLGGTDAAVVYVDQAPVVGDVERLRLLDGHPYAAAIHADSLAPVEVLTHPTIRQMFDLQAPIALLAIDTLQWMDDEAAEALVVNWAQVLSSQSYIGVTQYGHDPRLLTAFTEFQRLYDEPPPEIWLRSVQALEQILVDAGLVLVEPGAVPLPKWHPAADESEPADDQAADQFPVFAALGKRTDDLAASHGPRD